MAEVTPERIDAARDAARRLLNLTRRLPAELRRLQEANIPADEKDAELVAKFYELEPAIADARDAMPSEIFDSFMLAAGPGEYVLDGKHFHPSTAHEATAILALATLCALAKGAIAARLSLTEPLPSDSGYADPPGAVVRLLQRKCGCDVVLTMLRGESEQVRAEFWDVAIAEVCALNVPATLRRSLDIEWAAARRALAADGMKPTPAAASEMRHGPDFRSLAWGDSQYAFTPSQAAVVKVLWEARGNRTPDVGEQFIIEAVESCGSRLRDIFSKHPAWGTLIVPGQTKGTFRLAE